MFAVGGIVYAKLLSPERSARILGVPNRFAVALGLSLTSVGVEIFLHSTGTFHWTYWWWNVASFPVIVVFGYLWFFLFAAWVFDAPSPRSRWTRVGALAAIDLVIGLTFGSCSAGCSCGTSVEPRRGPSSRPSYPKGDAPPHDPDRDHQSRRRLSRAAHVRDLEPDDEQLDRRPRRARATIRRRRTRACRCRSSAPRRPRACAISAAASSCSTCLRPGVDPARRRRRAEQAQRIARATRRHCRRRHLFGQRADDESLHAPVPPHLSRPARCQRELRPRFGTTGVPESSSSTAPAGSAVLRDTRSRQQWLNEALSRTFSKSA